MRQLKSLEHQVQQNSQTHLDGSAWYLNSKRVLDNHGEHQELTQLPLPQKVRLMPHQKKEKKTKRMERRRAKMLEVKMPNKLLKMQD